MYLFGVGILRSLKIRGWMIFLYFFLRKQITLRSNNTFEVCEEAIWLSKAINFIELKKQYV